MASTTLVIGDNEIIYNGIRYVPDPYHPAVIKIYLMRDNHTFIRVYGKTPATVIAKMHSILRKNKDANVGSVIVLSAEGKELHRYSFNVSEQDKLNDILSKKENKVLLKNNAEPYVVKRVKKVSA